MLTNDILSLLQIDENSNKNDVIHVNCLQHKLDDENN